MQNKSKLAIATLAISTLLASSAFAANAEFSGNLPANHGDTEVSTVARANETNAVKYFSIKITSLGNPYTSVRAWTESWSGSNFSDPYKEVKANSEWATINYTSVPAKGAKVSLNLDNPVYSTSTVPVAGTWSPN